MNHSSRWILASTAVSAAPLAGVHFIPRSSGTSSVPSRLFTSSRFGRVTSSALRSIPTDRCRRLLSSLGSLAIEMLANDVHFLPMSLEYFSSRRSSGFLLIRLVDRVPASIAYLQSRAARTVCSTAALRCHDSSDAARGLVCAACCITGNCFETQLVE